MQKQREFITVVALIADVRLSKLYDLWHNKFIKESLHDIYLEYSSDG